MLSCQHADRPGNSADRHKHVAVASLLARLTTKPRGISYLDSHSGRGVYDLAAQKALKIGKAAQGIALLPEGNGPVWEALRWCRVWHGVIAYPGSPIIARALTRPQDRLQLCELHPTEHAPTARTVVAALRAA